MKILYIHKAYYDKRPPMIATVESLIQLGHRIILVTSGIEKKTKASLEKRGVVVHNHGVMPVSKLDKGLYYLKFRKRTKKVIRNNKNSLVWIASLDAAIAIGKTLLKSRYILQIQELYDKKPAYLRMLKKYINGSILNIVPDNARALIFRSWYNLKTTPYVLPNKPHLDHIISADNINTLYEGFNKKNNDKIYLKVNNANNKKKLKAIKNKKLVLYQAAMIRMDLFDIAQALLELGDEYVLGLFGGIRDKEKVARLIKNYPNTIYFESMLAPDHLRLTSYAWLGILTYNYESLNNVFCAPNKIWEYSAFGIPMLANNLPILKLQLEKFNAGLTYEFGNVLSIKKAIIEISNNYDLFKKGSFSLYDSVNMEQKVSEIIDIIKHNGKN